MINRIKTLNSANNIYTVEILANMCTLLLITQDHVGLEQMRVNVSVSTQCQQLLHLNDFPFTLLFYLWVHT